MVLKLTGITLPNTLTYPNLNTDFQLFSMMKNPPVTTGLLGSYFLGSKNPNPLQNFANSSLPLTVIGTPVYSNEYATVSYGTGYFNTQISSSEVMTVLAIAQVTSSAATPATIISNYNGTTGDTLALDLDSVTSYVQSSAGLAVPALTLSGSSAGDYAVVSMVISGDGNPQAGSWQRTEAGVLNSAVTAFSARTVPTGNLLLGSTYSSTQNLSPANISAVLIYDTDITTTDNDAGLTEVMNWLRNTVGVQSGIWSS